MADLITTHEYKDAEGIRGEKDDDRLNVLVPQISELVKKYCGTIGPFGTVFSATEQGNTRPWPQGVGSVKITYNAGYTDTPKDLKLAVFDLVTYYLKDEHKIRQTLGGATLQNQGTSGMRTSTDFPDHIKRVLDLYRVVV